MTWITPLPSLSLLLAKLVFFLYLFLIKLLIHALVIHIKKPLNNRCHMSAQWTIPVAILHSLYVATLVGVTAAVHHIQFRFDELRDLWRGILVSSVSIGTLFPIFYKILHYIKVSSISFLLISALRKLSVFLNSQFSKHE
jgi:hypothetical protein